ncbi:MAG: VOC family protein [Myxococcota bacterium]
MAIKLNKLAPILVVDAIEPCLSFWTDRLGFKKTVEVPEGGHLGFVILAKDGVEIMYQSRASITKDIPALSSHVTSTLLYLDVTGFAELEAALKGVDVVQPKRQTFYGATEIWVREPGGNVVGFAAR